MAEGCAALSLVEKARIFAAERHSGTFRKNKNKDPFILHPEEVARLVTCAGGSDEEVAAAWLHDTVEDTQTTLNEIEEHFGPEVKMIVDSVTDPPEFSKLPLLIRKASQALRVRSKSKSVKLLKLADQISNVRSIAADPPITWDRQKCSDYLEGTRLIAKECHGVNDYLDSQFELVHAEAVSKS